MAKTHIIRLATGSVEERGPARARALSREEKAEQRAYMEKVRQRCREFRDLRYCASCHLALEVIHSFCNKCAKATEPLPTAYAIEYARNEFPDLVRTREDFDRLVE